jgi:uncharacterized protein (DUF488 family)
VIQQQQSIATIGHSTRTLEDLIGMLKAHGIEALADVRQFPKSRRYPHFNSESLAIALPQAGIEYAHFQALGGRRRARSDSPNTGWRNEGFRGYADYMQSADFAEALESLMSLAARKPTAIMCAEALPWRCHRSLIADALVVRGWSVLDILGLEKAAPHSLTPFAHVEGAAISYPNPQEQTPGLFDEPKRTSRRRGRADPPRRVAGRE